MKSIFKKRNGGKTKVKCKPLDWDLTPYDDANIISLVKRRTFLDRIYDIYDMSRYELGDFINIWFFGDLIKETYKRSDKENVIVDEIYTVKRVTNDTANRLYGKIYNPLSICIMSDNKEDVHHNMKAMIHSIDNASYGIWFKGDYDKLVQSRIKLMKWISSEFELDGEDFLKKCIELGAHESTIEYD